MLTSTEVSSWTRQTFSSDLPPFCYVSHRRSLSSKDVAQWLLKITIYIMSHTFNINDVLDKRWILNFRCVKEASGERHRGWRSTICVPGGDAGGAQHHGCNRRRGCRHGDGVAGCHHSCVTLIADLANSGLQMIQWCNDTQEGSDSRLRTD